MAEIVARLEAILSLQERLDSSETEGKFVNKVSLLFAGKPNASTLISALTLDGEGEPINEIKGKVISASMLQSPSSTGMQTTRIPPVDLKAFSFLELKLATRNFRPSAMIGSHAETLHKGWIDEQYAPSKLGIGIPIAVKRLNESLQGHKEWLADHIKVLGLLNHPNLVKIIGYCLEDDHSRLLVSEYMVKGSLGTRLFGRRNIDPLSWSVRLKIAAGFAKGLAYLHSPEVNVIYRELKSSNIFLDPDYNTKLCMAWMAKGDLLDGKASISTRVTGTSGYAAPEYIATGDLTVASNIYTFGVVFLEILTGRQCIDENRPLNDQILVKFVKSNLSKKRGIHLIIDSKIDEQFPPDIAMTAIKLAMKCLLQEPKHRPTANEVVTALEKLQHLSKLATEKKYLKKVAESLRNER
ncbi:receptor-like cytoplasmic kinase 176 [Tanacetum coccineum]